MPNTTESSVSQTKSSLPIVIGWSKKGFIYINNNGWLISLQTQHSIETIENYFSRLPEYRDRDHAAEVNPELK